MITYRRLLAFLPLLFSLVLFVSVAMAQVYPGFPSGYSISSSEEANMFTKTPFSGEPVDFISSTSCPDYSVNGDFLCGRLNISEGFRAYRNFTVSNSGERVIFGARVFHSAGSSVCIRIRLGNSVVASSCSSSSGHSGILWACTPVGISGSYSFALEPTAAHQVYFDNYFSYSSPSCPGSPPPLPTPLPANYCDALQCVVEHVGPGGTCFNPTTGITHTINLMRDGDFSSGIFPNTAWPYHPVTNYPFPSPGDYYASQYAYVWDNQSVSPDIFLASGYVEAYPEIWPVGFCQDIAVREDGLYGFSGVGDGRVVIYSPSPYLSAYPYQLLEYNLFDCGGDANCFSDTVTNFGVDYVSVCLQPYQGNNMFRYGDLMLVPVVQSPISNTVEYMPNCNELLPGEGGAPPEPSPTPLVFETLPPLGTLPPPIFGTPTPYQPPVVITPQATICAGGWDGYELEVGKDLYQVPGLSVCVEPHLISFDSHDVYQLSFIQQLFAFLPIFTSLMMGSIFLIAVRKR